VHGAHQGHPIVAGEVDVTRKCFVVESGIAGSHHNFSSKNFAGLAGQSATLSRNHPFVYPALLSHRFSLAITHWLGQHPPLWPIRLI
jgi:hypothetical protein